MPLFILFRHADSKFRALDATTVQLYISSAQMLLLIFAASNILYIVEQTLACLSSGYCLSTTLSKHAGRCWVAMSCDSGLFSISSPLVDAAWLNGFPCLSYILLISRSSMLSIVPGMTSVACLCEQSGVFSFLIIFILTVKRIANRAADEAADLALDQLAEHFNTWQIILSSVQTFFYTVYFKNEQIF